jgi:hypothetical protein
MAFCSSTNIIGALKRNASTTDKAYDVADSEFSQGYQSRIFRHFIVIGKLDA